ncbi:MAG: hypothetical protein II976_06825 [Alistipes sp.]|nr:hypothetical protein [Alistipes sp.]
MDTLKQRIYNTLATIGYEDVMVADTTNLNLEAVKDGEKILFVPLIEEFTHCESYMRYALQQARSGGYNAINFVAQSARLMDIFDELELDEYCDNLKVEWIILKNNKYE